MTEESEEKVTLPMDEPNPIVDGPKLDEATSEPDGGKAEAAPERERDEHGRFKAKDEKGETKDAPPASPKDDIPVGALQDERRKRQELQQQLENLQRQVGQSRKDEPPPNIWENEEKWQQHFGDQVTQQATATASLNAKLDMSEMMAAQSHDDFDDMRTLFLEMAEQNPELRRTALQDRHPWERAYQIARNHKTMQELNATSIEDLKAKLRAELEAELKAKAPVVPKSTAHDGSVSGRGGPVWDGEPTPMKDILPMG